MKNVITYVVGLCAVGVIFSFADLNPLLFFDSYRNWISGIMHSLSPAAGTCLVLGSAIVIGALGAEEELSTLDS
ncbi:MAG: hypothetical protein WC289_00680 [Patescibacteria group bacterium]|jgi:hypothetical protein